MINEDLIQIGNNVFVISQNIIDRDNYKYRVTNTKNQCVEMQFRMFYDDNVNRIKYWSLTLSVNKKSKGYEYGKQTGKAGIESLLIAKEILKYHINYIKTKFHKNRIIIWGDDTRRLNAYTYGLRSLGFDLRQMTVAGLHTGKCLFKEI